MLDVQAVDSILAENCIHLAEGILLQEQDKYFLLKAARVFLENYFLNKKLVVSDFSSVPANILQQNFRCFVSLYRKSRLVGCYGSRKENLLASVISATEMAIEDDRFEKMKAREVKNSVIEITILFSPKKIPGGSLSVLEKKIALGIHSIQLRNGEATAFFKNSVPVTYGYTLKKNLQQLAKKAGLSAKAYKDKNTIFYVYRTVDFREGDPKHSDHASILNVYRGHLLTPQSYVTKHTLEQALKALAKYLVAQTDENGVLTYEYDPRADKKSLSNENVAVIRRLASTWMMATLGHALPSEECVKAAKRSLRCLMDSFYCYDEKNQFGFVKIDDSVGLGAAAFLLLGLTAIEESDFQSDTKKQLADFIFSLEDKEKGFLYPTYLPDKTTHFDQKQLYYPGEALTALMCYYQKTKDHRCIETAERVFNYYRELFRKNDLRMNMAAWMSKAYCALYAVTQEKKYADFVFEINDYVINKQFGIHAAYADLIGSFSTSGNACATGVFLESIAEGLQVATALKDATRMKAYSDSLLLGMRFILQMQYRDEYLQFIANPLLAEGGIKTGFFDPNIRIDNVQHCACAILKTLKNLPLFC